MRTNTVAPLLELADNMLGKLTPALKKRIECYLKRPSFEGWEDIHCIIIDGGGKVRTIWNAVIEIDPFFPRTGRTTDIKNTVIKEWDEYPSAEKVIHAINQLVLRKQISNN